MANINPAGVFDTTYQEDMSIDRTRRDKLLEERGLPFAAADSARVDIGPALSWAGSATNTSA